VPDVMFIQRISTCLVERLAFQFTTERRLARTENDLLG